MSGRNGGRKREMSRSPDTPKAKGRKQTKHNQPEAIAEEEYVSGSEDESDDSDVSDDLEELVATKLKEIEALRSAKTKKTKKTSVAASTSSQHTGSAIPLVQQIIKELTPLLVAVITESVATAVQKEVKSLRKELKKEKGSTAQYAQQQVLLLHYEKDKLE